VTTAPVVLARGAAARAATLSGATVARLALAALVAGAFAWRIVASLGRTTATYMPDEFLYSDIARSLAREGRPALRGEALAFPALLDPILTAPFWLAGDVESAFRATQAFHSLAMALAAVPAYLLCRSLRLDRSLALAAAAFTVVQPAGIFAGWATADAVGFTLALFALWAAVRALERPAPAAQALAFALAALATFARVQYVVLLAVVPVGALVLDRSRLRHWWPTAAMLLAGAAGAVAVGPGRLAGIYRGVTTFDHGAADMADALEVQLTGLAHAWSAALLPGAVVGAGLALLRPRHRAERAFGTAAVVVCVALLAEAAVIGAGVGGGRFLERYLIVLAPLLVPAFALSLARGRAPALASVAGAAALVVVTAREPVSELTGGDFASDSPTLRAVLELQQHAGTAGAAAIAAALVGALALVGAVAALRPHLRMAALGAAICGSLAVALLASALDRDGAQRAAALLPTSKSWIDDERLPRVALLATPGTAPGVAYQQLFWNRSVRDVLRMPGVAAIDQASSLDATVARDGTVLAGGVPVSTPLAVSTYGSTVRMRGVDHLASTPTATLVRPAGRMRLELLADRTHDGWLGLRGYVRIWQPPGAVRGTLVLTLQGPGAGRRSTISLRAPGLRRAVTLAGDERRQLRIAVASAGPWRLEYRAARGTMRDGRVTSARAPAPPRFLPTRTPLPGS
jgi:hypothetical protein